ncbi:uncharacterized transposon-derived protein F54H12.3 [Trichonephila clavipes]|nr:uncharacterized transposon-derived protein F54H12.3 [Trichonephila clavipes]
MKVGIFTTNNKAKASIVERFNRTLKTKMWKYFTEMNTKCYIDVLGKLVYSYNHTWRRSIRMEPSSGTFYPQELQKVSDSGFYPVEKVVRTRKRNGKSEYLVKFQGYPDKFNAWLSDVRML